MSKELTLNITATGEIYRAEDNKLIAEVNKENGEVKYTNPAYAKGAYKEAINGIIFTTDEGPEEREPQPARCPSLGAFSAEWINWDHRNLSDEDFAAKYKASAASQLDFILRKPGLFQDIEALEERLDSLNA